MSSHRITSFVACLAMCAGALGAPLGAQAETDAPEAPDAPVTITVNTLLDKLDANDGKCSLREAMARAFGSPGINLNECPATNGNTLIKFAVAGTVVLTSAVNHGSLPDTRNTVTIQGPVTIDAGNVPQIIFDVESDGILNLVNVTVKNASYTAVDNRGTLQVAGGAFENNSAGGVGGGAIRNGGTATIAGVTFTNNKSVRKPDEGAGVTRDGGAIYTSWKLSVAGSTFKGNVADGEGGAIKFVGGWLDIADSEFSGNVAKGQLPSLNYDGSGGAVGEGGGAISLRASSNTYPMTIKRTSFSGNSVLEGVGGAIHHDGGAMLTISDSSFQANHVGADGKLGAGGAIHNQSQITAKRVMFVANTATGDGGALAMDKDAQIKLVMVGMTGNNASGKGGAITFLNTVNSDGKIVAKAVAINGNLAGDKGGGIYNHDSKYDKAEFRMSVISYNLPQNCRDKTTSDENTPNPGDEEQYPIDSKGQNSFSDQSCDAPEDDDEVEDAQQHSPVLEPNGSTTPGMLTQRPYITGTLVDRIAPAAYNPENDPDLAENLDIRGMPRVANGKGIGIPLIDIGPFELDEASPEFSSLPAPGTVITVGNASVGTYVTRTSALQVLNGGAAALNLSNVGFSGAHAADFVIAPVPSSVAGNGSQFHALACKPAAAGTRTATLSFNTNDTRPGKGSASYTVRCVGDNTPKPGFSAYPPPPGPINTQTTAGVNDAFVFSVREVGNATLTLSNPSLVSDQPGAFTLNTAFPVNIPNGSAAVNIQLTCNAASPGLKTGKLTFNTNDATRPSVTFDLACQVGKAADPVFGATYWTNAGLSPNSFGPYGIAVSPDGKHAYVADQGSNKIVIYNAQTADTGQQMALSYAGNFDSGSLSAGTSFAAPIQVAVSADGQNVYATGLSGDSIVVFQRDVSDGSLAWVDTVKQGDGYNCPFFGPCASFLAGMDGAYGIALSPDGKHVYVSSVLDGSIVALRRRTSDGALSDSSPGGTGVFFVQRFTHGSLTSPYGIAISPDGAQVYVTGFGSDTLMVLKRDAASGQLSFKQSIGTAAVARLEGVFRVIVSPDGRFVYTAGGSASGNGGVCRFSRNILDGALTYQTCVFDTAARALDGASDLALSPDGARLFVTSRFENGVNVFDRNVDTGALSYVESVSGTGAPTPLSTARGVAVSPNGKYVYATGYSNDTVVSLAIANPVPLAGTIAPAAAINNPGTVFTMTVNGSGFIPGARVRLNGIDMTSEYVNDTQMKARVTSLAMGVAGDKNITVWNPGPGGGSSNALTFKVLPAGSSPIPSVLGVSVLGVSAGSGPVTVTVDGANFVNGAQVQWNGSPRPTTYVRNTQLIATLTTADLSFPGTSAIKVQNPDALQAEDVLQPPSAPVAFTVVAPNVNPPPSVSSLTPVSADQLAPITSLDVTVRGRGFVVGAQAQYDGQDRPTQYVNATTLKMTLNAGDLVAPGAHSVTVINPAPGGGGSNTLTFTVDPFEPQRVVRVRMPIIRRQ